MRKIDTSFLTNLGLVLTEFRRYQLDNEEPYAFDLLGFMDWLESEKGIRTL